MIRYEEEKGRKITKKLKLQGLERSGKELLTENGVIQSLLDLSVVVALRKRRGLKEHDANKCRCRHSHWGEQKRIKIQSQSKMLLFIYCKNGHFHNSSVLSQAGFFHTEICQ